MVSKGFPVAVVYLARGTADTDQEKFRRFAASYQSIRSGMDHRLYVILKGFGNGAERRKAASCFNAVETTFIELDDSGFDLGSYAASARTIEEAWVCFLNTHTVLIAENWLRIMFTHAVRASTGMVGATGSFESLTYFGLDTPEFPNPHLRSNGFLIRKDLFVELTENINIADKKDAFLLESGKQSLSLRIAGRGLRLLIAGRNGRAYSSDHWPASETFRQGTQSNLLIADNQTQLFAAANPMFKLKLSRHAWGRCYDNDDSIAVGDMDGRRTRLQTLIDHLTKDAQVDSWWYLRMNPDVARAGVGAAAHYAKHGRAEGRFPNAESAALNALALSVNREWYLNKYPNVRQTTFDAVEYHLRMGRYQAFSPNPQAEDIAALCSSVDPAWYFARYPQAAATGMRAPTHFVTLGMHLGFFPNAAAEEEYGVATSRDFDLSHDA